MKLASTPSLSLFLLLTFRRASKKGCFVHDMSARGRSRSASPASPASPHASQLARIAQQLGATEAEAAAVQPSLLAEIAEALSMSAIERGMLDVEVQRVNATKAASTTDPVSALTAHFSAQELRDLEPWRKRFQQLRQRGDQWKAMPIPDLRSRFTALAKDGQLSATEVLLGYLALYADEEERCFMAGLICCESDADRMPQFNYAIAAKKGDTFLAQYGTLLGELAFPLFPPGAEFDIVNQRLLREHTAAIGAGDGRPSVYRRCRGHDDILGAGTLPVQQAPDGTYGVDVTVVEQSFDTVFNNLRQLSSKVDAAVKDRSEKQLSSLTSTVAELRRTVTAAQRSALPFNNRPEPRRQQHGGRQQQPQQRRGRGPRGGDAEGAPLSDF
ncbi:MAG: hypothetical protein COA68_12290 [Oceanobacter sp.]|nr:MAG: hypothetical protein COA68_12290 [Oceanobacter sp.]